MPPTIQLLTAASGLDIYLKDVNNNLIDPQAITYDIIEPSGTTVFNDVSGYRVSKGYYDARNSIIPNSGFDLTNNWSIIWSITAPGGAITTATEEFIVASGLSFSFVEEISNKEDLIEKIRLDMSIDTTAYSDSQMITFLIKAITRINRKLQLTGTTSEMSYNVLSGAITPEPNDDLFDLIMMQSECLVVKSRNSSAIGKGIRVRDDDTEIDTTAGFSGHMNLVKDVCGELDKAITEYFYYKKGAAQNGKISWYATQRILADMDHSGQGTGQTRDFSSPFDSGISFSF